MRKEGRKAKKLGITKVKKKHEKISIPLLWPFKQQELQNIQDMNDKREKDREVMKEKQKSEQRQKEREVTKKERKAAKKPMAELPAILTAAELIIEVLDARDPSCGRSKEVESFGKAAKLLVLTKCDKVDTEHLTKWLSYLRKSFPTACIAFQDGKKPLGMNTLREIVKRFAFKTCAVVGYGKISDATQVCQMLRKCSWSSSRTFAEARIDGESPDLELLDRPQAADSPISVVDRLVERAAQEDIQLGLTVPKYQNTLELLACVEKERKVPPIDAARIVLKLFTAKGFAAEVPDEKAIIEDASSVEKSTVEGAPSVEKVATEEAPVVEKADAEMAPVAEKAAAKEAPAAEKVASEGAPVAEKADAEMVPVAEKVATEEGVNLDALYAEELALFKKARESVESTKSLIIKLKATARFGPESAVLTKMAIVAEAGNGKDVDMESGEEADSDDEEDSEEEEDDEMTDEEEEEEEEEDEDKKDEDEEMKDV
eukprot:GEMP01033427.1.p1 GENE.GEMP01033427.1~~GEMP01033427.1.p1  ORF type:complete len:525 (-),score=162.05 GEMP01033427.1:541-2001(-)